jgi:hypothetical protein
LFFQTSARSCWATVIRFIVMIASFFFLSSLAQCRRWPIQRQQSFE